MKVYRVEHGTYGRGPYGFGFDVHDEYPDLQRLSFDLTFAHRDVNEYPDGWRDFGSVGPSERFACKTIPPLKRWFDGFLDRLHESGFEICEYQVLPRFVREGISGKQVTFLISEATLVRTIPLVD